MRHVSKFSLLLLLSLGLLCTTALRAQEPVSEPKTSDIINEQVATEVVDENAPPAPEALDAGKSSEASTAPEADLVKDSVAAAIEEAKDALKEEKDEDSSRKVELSAKIKVSNNDPIPLTPVLVEEGTVSKEAVSIFASTKVRGEVRNDAVAVFGPNEVSGKVGGDAVAVFGPNTITGQVRGDAVAVFGNLHIDGEVKGDVVCVFGTLTFGPNAIVHGESTCVFGIVNKDPAAQVLGGIQKVGANEDNPLASAAVEWVHNCLLKGRLLSFSPYLLPLWILAFIIVLLNAGVTLLARNAVTAHAQLFRDRPGGSILAALLSVMMTPLIFVLLSLTGIGALLIPFIVLGLMLATLYGHVVMQAWFGQVVAWRPLGIGTASLLGGTLLVLLCAVPVIGLFVMPLVGFLGTGVALYACLRALSRPSTPRTPPSQGGTGFTATAPKPASPTAPSPVTPLASLPVQPPVDLMGTAPVIDVQTTESPDLMQAPETKAEPLPTQPENVQAASTAQATFTAGEKSTPPLTASTGAQAPLSTLPRASFGVRMLALGIDLVLVALLANWFTSMMPRFMRIDLGLGSILVFLAIYGALMWKYRGASIGDIIMKLQVVRADDKPLDWGTCVIRGLGCLLSAIALGMGFIWIAIDPDKEAWHDKIAGTAVVVVPKNRPLV